MEKGILQGNGSRYHAVLLNFILSFCGDSVLPVLYGFSQKTVDTSVDRKFAVLCMAGRTKDRLFADHICNHLVGRKGF